MQNCKGISPLEWELLEHFALFHCLFLLWTIFQTCKFGFSFLTPLESFSTFKTKSGVISWTSVISGGRMWGGIHWPKNWPFKYHQRHLKKIRPMDASSFDKAFCVYLDLPITTQGSFFTPWNMSLKINENSKIGSHSKDIYKLDQI